MQYIDRAGKEGRHNVARAGPGPVLRRLSRGSTKAASRGCTVTASLAVEA